MIVGLLGKKQSGKDTSARLLVERLGFKRIAFADALKDLTAEILDLDPAFVRSEDFKLFATDLRSGREWLQCVGVAVRDVLGVDTWVNVVRAKMDADPSTNWVVTDVRFQNEHDALRRLSLCVCDENCVDEQGHKSSWFYANDCYGSFQCDRSGPAHQPRTRLIRCARTLPDKPFDIPSALAAIDAHVSETELDDAKVDLLVTTDSADATAQAVLAAVEGWLKK